MASVSKYTVSNVRATYSSAGSSLTDCGGGQCAGGDLQAPVALAAVAGLVGPWRAGACVCAIVWRSMDCTEPRASDMQCNGGGLES